LELSRIPTELDPQKSFSYMGRTLAFMSLNANNATSRHVKLLVVTKQSFHGRLIILADTPRNDTKPHFWNRADKTRARRAPSGRTAELRRSNTFRPPTFSHGPSKAARSLRFSYAELVDPVLLTYSRDCIAGNNCSRIVGGGKGGLAITWFGQGCVASGFVRAW
jgi:hypothetical protein